MKNSGINKVTTTLIHLLCNKKRDGLILLDGEWGTGKTHYINREFRNKYDKKTIFNISTLGINSVEMFKSELFNISYLKLSEDIKNIPDIATSAIALGTQTPAAAAPLKNIVASIGDAIKKSKLSALEGLFIIDDIERIDQKLANEILGYCHSIYMQSDKIDFIIVSNTSKTSSFEIQHKEKIFSDTVPFIPTEEDIYALFENELSFFDKDQLKALQEATRKYKLVNIRVIRRIISGLCPIFEFRVQNPSKEINANLELVISVFTALVILARNYNYTLPQIEDFKKNHDKETTQLNILVDAATATGVPKEVKQYAFSIASKTDVIEAIFYDKQQIQIDTVVLSDKILISEIEEVTVVNRLIEIVKQKERQPLKAWEAAINNYKVLIEGKYIKNDESITNELLMSIAESYSKEEVSQAFYIDSTHTADKSEIDKARASGDVRKYLSIKHSYDKQNVIQNKIKEDILNQGWHLFNTERLEECGYRVQFSPLEFIGVDVICEGVFNKWAVIDILKFKDYLSNLYGFTNVKDFLIGELKYLRMLSEKLQEYLSKNSVSFQYGAINSLSDLVRHLITRLEPEVL